MEIPEVNRLQSSRDKPIHLSEAASGLPCYNDGIYLKCFFKEFSERSKKLGVEKIPIISNITFFILSMRLGKRT